MNIRLPLAILALSLLPACQSAAPQPSAPLSAATLPVLRAEYQALAKTAEVYAVDPAASKVRIYVFRDGAAARLGHNHVLSAPVFEGYVSVSSQQAADARFELRLAMADLSIDDPDARSETGGNFEGAPTASDIQGTREHMLGERGFQSDRFPIVRLRSLAIEGDWPVLVAQLEITLHGVTRTQPLMLNVERSAAGLKVTGSFTLRQSDFGVTPFSAFGGVIKVQDAVAVAFTLVARPASF